MKWRLTIRCVSTSSKKDDNLHSLFQLLTIWDDCFWVQAYWRRCAR